MVNLWMSGNVCVYVLPKARSFLILHDLRHASQAQCKSRHPLLNLAFSLKVFQLVH